jgi:hypothetical protein
VEETAIENNNAKLDRLNTPV